MLIAMALLTTDLAKFVLATPLLRFRKCNSGKRTYIEASSTSLQ